MSGRLHHQSRRVRLLFHVQDIRGTATAAATRAPDVTAARRAEAAAQPSNGASAAAAPTGKRCQVRRRWRRVEEGEEWRSGNQCGGSGGHDAGDDGKQAVGAEHRKAISRVAVRFERGGGVMDTVLGV